MTDTSLQLWNNAVFYDDCSSGASATIKASPPRYAFRPISAVPSKSEHFVLSAGKENRSPGLRGIPALGKSASLAGKTFTIKPAAADEGSIDAEIAEVEEEIRRLSSRLEALRHKKAHGDLPGTARRGRIVPSKILEPKQSSAKKPEDVPTSSRKTGESPACVKFRQRSASLGPLDIVSGVRLRQPVAPNGTPIRWVQSRGKDFILHPQGTVQEDGEEEENKEDGGCSIVGPEAFGLNSSRNVESRLGSSEIAAAAAAAAAGFCYLGNTTQEIKEHVEPRKERGRSLCSSPNSRNSAANMTTLRKGIATIESKKHGKRGSVSAKSFQTKTLIQEVKKPVKREGAAPKSIPTKAVPQEVRKSVPVQRPWKNSRARTVSSRYSLITVRIGRDAAEGKRRKPSLPGNGKDEPPGFKKLRVSLPVLFGQSPAEERPGEVNDDGTLVGSSPTSSIMRIARSLPEICTVRCDDAESPRDSGRAKRAVELIGRESPFGSAMEKEEATASISCESADLEEDGQ